MLELWFLRSARRLMLIDIYMKFLKDILNKFQVKEQKQFCDRQIPRVITQKVYLQELWFLCSAHCLMLIDTYMKFREANLNSFQVIEWT